MVGIVRCANFTHAGVCGIDQPFPELPKTLTSLFYYMV